MIRKASVGRFIVASALVLVAGAAQAGAVDPDGNAICPAETVRNVPDFPAACFAVPDDEHKVTVQYDVDETGQPVNIEIADYTDACFVEATRSAVQTWRFSCDLAGASGKKSILTFKKNAPVTPESRPYLRVPPAFPRKCQRYKGTNAVTVQFDIDESGATKNVEAIEYTEKCFTKAAVETVRQWRYDPASGPREDVETVVTFKLMD